MDVREAIKIRRSIRFYSQDRVPDGVIRELLDAARLSPSGCNAQPWRFCVIRDPETIGALRRQNAFPQDFVYKAPAIMACCGDPDAYIGRYGGENQVADGSVPEDAAARKELFSLVEGKNVARALRDVSIASAFLVLRATELGLATSYIGLINETALRGILAIPRRFILPFVITLGYEQKGSLTEKSQKSTPARTPRKEIADILLPSDSKLDR